MGNTRSLPSDDDQDDIWWGNASKTVCSEVQTETDEDSMEEDEEQNRKNRRAKLKEELDEFKLELARKHEKRRQLISERKIELANLREEVQRLRTENEELKKQKGCEERTSDESFADIKQKNLELKMIIAEIQEELQHLNSEMIGFEKERQDYQAHVLALKDVISVSKQMLLIRETQLKELREKISEIEASLAGRELHQLSQNLKDEYERQLQNIRNLRIYYEERQRADRREKQELQRLVDDTKKDLEDEQKKKTELQETVDHLEEDNSSKYDEIKNLESNLGLSKAECRQYQAELAVINQLFSQILLGFNNNQEVNMDKLIKVLEENHHILRDIAFNEVSAEVSALPKVLLDLVTEISEKPIIPEDGGKENVSIIESQNLYQLNSASEIVENLPKVWRVLIELLSHQCAPANDLSRDGNDNPCYKTVQTPKGPHLAISVSQTFIRLKDLILEKKSLERETCRLKQLNTHLECRLQDQEKRLELVSNELSETWHVVGKLQKKHQLLHTQEKILRYELAQKRILLNELKEELEYSREKWQEAREKNSNTERQWEQLRIEFASRKNVTGDDCNNSLESGYSEEEPGYETDVSECNQKISAGEEAAAEAASIVDVVQSEILAIESTSDEEGSRSEETTEARTLEEVLAARDERFLRLENQCSSLVKQVTDTSNRGTAIANKLDTLHEIYGESSRDGGVNEGDESNRQEEEGN